MTGGEWYMKTWNVAPVPPPHSSAVCGLCTFLWPDQTVGGQNRIFTQTKGEKPNSASFHGPVPDFFECCTPSTPQLLFKLFVLWPKGGLYIGWGGWKLFFNENKKHVSSFSFIRVNSDKCNCIMLLFWKAPLHIYVRIHRKCHRRSSRSSSISLHL